MDAKAPELTPEEMVEHERALDMDMLELEDEEVVEYDSSSD
jgi:hypothetical protein